MSSLEAKRQERRASGREVGWGQPATSRACCQGDCVSRRENFTEAPPPLHPRAASPLTFHLRTTLLPRLKLPCRGVPSVGTAMTNFGPSRNPAAPRGGGGEDQVARWARGWCADHEGEGVVGIGALLGPREGGDHRIGRVGFEGTHIPAETAKKKGFWGHRDPGPGRFAPPSPPRSLVLYFLLRPSLAELEEKLLQLLPLTKRRRSSSNSSLTSRKGAWSKKYQLPFGVIGQAAGRSRRSCGGVGGEAEESEELEELLPERSAVRRRPLTAEDLLQSSNSSVVDSSFCSLLLR